MFKGSRLELQKWFIAIEFVLTGEKIIGIRDLAKELNVTINTSSRIRAKILQNAVLYLDFTDRITQFKN